MKLFNQNSNGYKNHGRFLGWGSGPDTDWRIMFEIFLFLFLVVSIWGGILFFKVSRADFSGETSSKEESPLDINLLKKTTTFYKDKKAFFETIRSIKETIPDPSI